MQQDCDTEQVQENKERAVSQNISSILLGIDKGFRAGRHFFSCRETFLKNFHYTESQA